MFKRTIIAATVLACGAASSVAKAKDEGVYDSDPKYQNVVQGLYACKGPGFAISRAGDYAVVTDGATRNEFKTFNGQLTLRDGRKVSVSLLAGVGYFAQIVSADMTKFYSISCDGHVQPSRSTLLGKMTAEIECQVHEYEQLGRDNYRARRSASLIIDDDLLNVTIGDGTTTDRDKQAADDLQPITPVADGVVLVRDGNDTFLLSDFGRTSCKVAGGAAPRTGAANLTDDAIRAAAAEQAEKNREAERKLAGMSCNFSDGTVVDGDNLFPGDTALTTQLHAAKNGGMLMVVGVGVQIRVGLNTGRASVTQKRPFDHNVSATGHCTFTN